MSRRPARIAEVVKGVEQADEVVALDRQRVRARDLEPRPFGDPSLRRRLACALDQPRCESKPTNDEAGKASAMMIVEAP
jgi:hypothetical protein